MHLAASWFDSSQNAVNSRAHKIVGLDQSCVARPFTQPLHQVEGPGVHLYMELFQWNVINGSA